MDAYIWRPNDGAHWSLVVSMLLVPQSFRVIEIGEMPHYEAGIVIITDNPIPPEKVKVMHLEPLE